MQASLVEMVLAIAIAGLIFASAIIPTTQTVVAYQQTEAEVRQATSQAVAAVRPEQIAASIWRDIDPPGNHNALLQAQPTLFAVGNWQLREDSGQFEQSWNDGGWTPIATPVQNFAFQYLLNSGVWASSASGTELENVLAVRFDWTDPDNGRKYGSLAVVPDRAFSAGLIELPKPDTSVPYRREDYEQTITFSLGSWQ